MRTVTLRGASDDGIVLSGAITDEFEYQSEDQGDLVAFSDGTVLRVTYTNRGVWRIVPVARGDAGLALEQAPENDEDNYTDRATLRFAGDTGSLWAVHGAAMATS